MGPFLLHILDPGNSSPSLSEQQRVKRKALSLLKMLTQFFCGAVYNAVQDGYNFFNLCRAVARLFITRGEGGGGALWRVPKERTS